MFIIGGPFIVAARRKRQDFHTEYNYMRKDKNCKKGVVKTPKMDGKRYIHSQKTETKRRR